MKYNAYKPSSSLTREISSISWGRLSMASSTTWWRFDWASDRTASKRSRLLVYFKMYWWSSSLLVIVPMERWISSVWTSVKLRVNYVDSIKLWIFFFQKSITGLKKLNCNKFPFSFFIRPSTARLSDRHICGFSRSSYSWPSVRQWRRWWYADQQIFMVWMIDYSQFKCSNLYI